MLFSIKMKSHLLVPSFTHFLLFFSGKLLLLLYISFLPFPCLISIITFIFHSASSSASTSLINFFFSLSFSLSTTFPLLFLSLPFCPRLIHRGSHWCRWRSSRQLLLPAVFIASGLGWRRVSFGQLQFPSSGRPCYCFFLLVWQPFFSSSPGQFRRPMSGYLES